MRNQKLTVVFIVLLIALGLGGFKYYQYKNPEKFAVESPDVKQNNFFDTESATKSSSSQERKNLPKITKEAPINGKLYGVIEVGASGFNSFVANIDKDDNWELVSKEFGESLAYEGFASVEDVKSGLKKYMANIFEKGVAGRNVHFVISSGALKNPKTEIIAKAIAAMGYVVNRVTATEEGQYALSALLDSKYRDNSFTVDIGSGNTKISWFQNGRIKSTEASGAKYYQDGKTDQDVYNEILQASTKIPTNLRANCFIIGGVPFKLAKESRSGEERFTILSAPKDYSFGDDVKKKSGLVIYKALYEGTQCDNFIFDWDANFTIGFLLGLN